MTRTGFAVQQKYYLEHIFGRCCHSGTVQKKNYRKGIRRRETMTDMAARCSGTTRRQAVAGILIGCGGLALGSSKAWGARAVGGEPEDGISHTAESIHQEPVFKASRKRVYEALTDTQQFDKVVQLSGAMKSMAPGAKPTEISREAGGAFTLFGGYVTGRQIELVPSERIVEAWRAGSWDRGAYSIVRFELVEQGTETKIVFDHTGFPKGTAEHLASGWKAHYWEPLEKLLA
jgi:activator of HSP90 ATPase